MKLSNAVRRSHIRRSVTVAAVLTISLSFGVQAQAPELQPSPADALHLNSATFCGSPSPGKDIESEGYGATDYNRMGCTGGSGCVFHQYQ